MKIIFQFSGLTITIDSDRIETECDAVLVASEVLKETQELGYGKPKFTWEKDAEVSDLQKKNAQSSRPQKNS